MANKWTPEQWQAIYARGGTLLVSAAAGSGKTSVLVQRVIERLTDETAPCDADRLLVVTFTKAAAAEMRQRISDRLTELLADRPFDARLQRQKLLLEKAKISTIHSFCSDLIRENFYKLGISPGFRIATEDEMVVLRDQAAQSVLEGMYAEAEKTPGFAALVELLGSDKDDRRLAGTMLQLYDFIRSTAFPEQWLRQKLDLYRTDLPLEKTLWGEILLEHAREMLEYAMAAGRDALATAAEEACVHDAYAPALSSDLAALGECLRLAQKKEWDRLQNRLALFSFERLGSLKKGMGEGVKKRVQGIRDVVKDVIKELCGYFSMTSREAMEEILDQKDTVEALNCLVLRLWEELERRKLDKNMLDYGDLEHYALKLLVRPAPGGYERTEEAAALSADFDEVMIDEYQDTNEAQNMIFSAVSREEKNLFMVGDVKQSIYRFRQAMPEIFIRRREAYPLFVPEKESYPATVLLGRNFRSRLGVTDAVNFVFRQLMSRRMGEIDYNDEEALVPAAEYPPSPTPDAYLHLIDLSAMEAEEEGDVLEARHIGAIIQKMVADGVLVSDHGAQRPACYRDFCILLSSAAKHAPNFVRELTGLGIPAWASTQGGFFAVREVTMTLSLLRVIDNPMQDVPLLAAMMSPIYGFTPDEMAGIRLCAPRAAIYPALKKRALSGDAHCSEFLRDLELFRHMAATMPADRLIQAIMDRKKLIALVCAMKGGEFRAANLRLLLEYARTYENAGYQGLSGFIRAIDRLQEQRSDLAPAAVVAESANVVRVMSIHHSKGLEFPVIFLAGCSVNFNKQGLYSDLLVHPSIGIGLKRRDSQTLARFRTAAYDAVRLETEKGELSERLRVLYVALTRAKEKLYMVGTIKNPEKKISMLAAQLEGDSPLAPFAVFTGRSFTDWLIMAALRHPNAHALREYIADRHMPLLPAEPWEIGLFLPEETKQQDEIPQNTVRPDPSPVLMQQLGQRLCYTYPYAALCHIPTKSGASALAEREVQEEFIATSRPAFLSKKGLTPAERGTALHEFMQFADYRRAAANPAEELARLVNQGYLTAEEGKAVELEKIQAFFAGKLAGRMFMAADKGGLHREVRFTMEVPAREFDDTLPEQTEESVVVQGVADCVMEESGTIFVIDYKTDRVKKPEELIRRYARQLSLYSRAMEKCFGLPVAGHVLYSFYLSQEISLPVKKHNGRGGFGE